MMLWRDPSTSGDGLWSARPLHWTESGTIASRGACPSRSDSAVKYRCRVIVPPPHPPSFHKCLHGARSFTFTWHIPSAIEQPPAVTSQPSSVSRPWLAIFCHILYSIARGSPQPPSVTSQPLSVCSLHSASGSVPPVKGSTAPYCNDAFSLPYLHNALYLALVVDHELLPPSDAMR